MLMYNQPVSSARVYLIFPGLSDTTAVLPAFSHLDGLVDLTYIMFAGGLEKTHNPRTRQHTI